MRKTVTVAIILILVSLTTLTTGCVVSLENYNVLEHERDMLIVKKNTLETEKETLEELNISLENGMKTLQIENEMKTLQEELTEISENYPAKNFPDAETLEAWLHQQPSFPESSDAILWLSHGLQIQKAALKDGYIINVELSSDDEIYYGVLCTAILEDGSYYWWDPETKDIYYWLDTRHF